MTHYIGNFKEDAHEQGKGGWLVGHFMDKVPFTTDLVEIKYWEYPAGPITHDSKTSTIWEYTFILEGVTNAMLDGKEVQLSAGQYVVIPPGVANNLYSLSLCPLKALLSKLQVSQVRNNYFDIFGITCIVFLLG